MLEEIPPGVVSSPSLILAVESKLDLSTENLNPLVVYLDFLFLPLIGDYVLNKVVFLFFSSSSSIFYYLA